MNTSSHNSVGSSSASGGNNYNSGNNNDNNNNSNVNTRRYTKVEHMEESDREQLRQKALEEADAVMSNSDYIGNHNHNATATTTGRPGRSGSNGNVSLTDGSCSYSYLDNFNLLGVVTTPRTLTLDGSSYHSSSHQTSTHGQGSDALQRRGSTANGDANVNGTTANGNVNASAVDKRTGSFGIDTSSASISSSLLDFSQMSDTLTKEIQSLNTTIYSYSQNYLGPYTSLEGFMGMNGGSISASGGGESKNYIGSSSTDFETELSMVGAGAYEDTPISQRPYDELPKEYLQLDLTTVEAYLRKCGRLAHKMKSYDSNRDEDGKLKIEGMGMGMGMGMGGAAAKSAEDERKMKAKGESDKDGNDDDMEDDPLSDIPEIFFSQEFDLTNPKIFESLLVLDGEDDDDDDGGMDMNGIENGNCNKNSADSMTPVIRIEKPEKFTQHLDNIELALLNQVRSKSDSFFRETNRFSYLKSLVADSVNEVTSLRAELDTIRDRSINDAEMIPIMDRRRNDIRDLVEVLDEIGDVLEVKSSVAGLIAAGDYLGAVDAIHMARRLLNGEKVVAGSGDRGNSSKEEAKEGASSNVAGQGQGQESRHVLKKLTALNKVNDQLTQYENLVVSSRQYIPLLIEYLFIVVFRFVPSIQIQILIMFISFLHPRGDILE